MRVGFYQYDSLFGEVAKNLDRVRARLEQAEADLIVLSELFASGYQFVSQEEAQRLAEPVPNGTTVRRLMDVAQRRRMHIVAGLPEQSGSQCYNSAVVVGPSGFAWVLPQGAAFFMKKRCFSRRAIPDSRSGILVWQRSG